MRAVESSGTCTPSSIASVSTREIRFRIERHRAHDADFHAGNAHVRANIDAIDALEARASDRSRRRAPVWPACAAANAKKPIATTATMAPRMVSPQRSKLSFTAAPPESPASKLRSRRLTLA